VKFDVLTTVTLKLRYSRMKDRAIPTFTRNLLLPSSGKQRPLFFYLKITQLVAPKYRKLPTKIRNVTSWMAIVFIPTAVRTSNPKHWRLSSTSASAPSCPAVSRLCAAHHNLRSALQSLSQRHRRRTGLSSQHDMTRPHSANLDGNCKQEVEEKQD
jgi:hypothetical protein